MPVKYEYCYIQLSDFLLRSRSSLNRAPICKRSLCQEIDRFIYSIDGQVEYSGTSASRHSDYPAIFV